MDGCDRGGSAVVALGATVVDVFLLAALAIALAVRRNLSRRENVITFGTVVGVGVLLLALGDLYVASLMSGCPV